MKEIPKKYKHLDIEQEWMNKWEESQVYAWDDSKSRDETFVVDTPPPTVSGSLHVGHVFSYTHTDLIVRFQRMRGKNIMYPMGWDDNGLPTERRVQNKFGIRCEPGVAYDSKWSATESSDNSVKEVSRQNFIEACQLVTTEDEKAFEDLWKNLGLSVDWNQQYATIDKGCRKVSQYSFLDLMKKGLVYSSEAPTMWDVGFQTALAQADVEDRERPGAYHDIEFSIEGGDAFVISTTRPELLPACIAVVAHPSDDRFKDLFGKFAITPLFKSKVPILASKHADPEKGSGILMVCTFGDSADVDWWKTSGLPIKQVLNRKGQFAEVEFGEAPFLSEDVSLAQENYKNLAGKYVNQARKAIVEMLSSEGSLVAEPKPITHPVKYYEKGDRPLEFVSTRQWFVRLLDQKENLLNQGSKIEWHPSFMRSRFDNWVEGLNYDWCISRQRFFGVPFPVWYPLTSEREIDYDNPIFADEASLPVDPLTDAAPGFKESQRGLPGGFTGDPDVMDTWATSSLTPQIVSQWASDKKRHESVFPMDMRPQSHEIIRTWAFYTIAKAWLHEKKIPWKNVVISGWILDPDRKKMSKSKGNVVTPHHLLEKYSADGVRYWASRARLGVDTAYDESVFKNGQKLATKLFNASKFVISQIKAFEDDGFTTSDLKVIQPLDASFVNALSSTAAQVTKAFEDFDYAQALQLTETRFWSFCDSYLELVKVRAYRGEGLEDRGSAIAALEVSLTTFLKLFAPFMPFLTEEVWSWRNTGSIHRAAWPDAGDFAVNSDCEQEVFFTATKVLSAIHQAKTKAQKSLKWPVESLEIKASELSALHIEKVKEDIVAAGVLRDSALKLLKADDEVSLEIVALLSDTKE